jgi:ABC-type Fe3+-hydroxamate transport system substrate-binding protein
MLIRIEDDMKRQLTFGRAPQRVVSLVPSDTYTVAALGCASALVGRTDYCELPREVHELVPSVGGTKNASVEKILALEPDLVIANQEENTKKDLETIAQTGVRVLVCFPKRAADGLAHLARMARVFYVERDPSVRDMLKRGYAAIAEAEKAEIRPLKTFCPIWMKPLMTIHGATFISDMLALAGAQNVFSNRERKYPLAADLGTARPLPEAELAGRDVRYPRITMEEVVERQPELVLLPDEPHPFSEEDAEEFRKLDIPAAKNGAVVRTGGKDLCWYGAWTVDALPRLRKLVDQYR